MTREFYRYTFSPLVRFAHVEDSLQLALIAVSAIHGESRTKLEAFHSTNPERSLCAIDATGEVGRDLCRVFHGYCTREFGEEGFTVSRIISRELEATGDVGDQPK